MAWTDGPDGRIHWTSSGAGAPLVLLHGLGGDVGFWELELASWSDAFRLLAIDLRGSGRTPPTAGGHTMSDLAADVVAVLDDAGLERAHVLGFSMGGCVAQTLAIDHPDRVDRLILASTFARMNTQARLFLAAVAAIYAQDLDPAQMFAVICPWLFSIDFIEDPVHEPYLTYPPEAAADEDPQAWQALYAAQQDFDARRSATRIESPTLVLHGDEDRLVSAADAASLSELIPDARLVTLAGAGHLINLESTAAFRRLVFDFLTAPQG